LESKRRGIEDRKRTLHDKKKRSEVLKIKEQEHLVQVQNIENMWALTIKSPNMSLKTLVDPNWQVNFAIQKIKSKFPEDTTNYGLYIETALYYLLLDEASLLKSFEQLNNNSELLFREKIWKGTVIKPAKLLTGKPQP